MSANVRTRHPERWQFFDPETIPWTPWGMPGTYFKLLNINEANGRFTFLLKVDAGIEAPVHKHLSEAEAYIISGQFGYGAARGYAGHYAYEAPGAVHIPDAPEELLLFAISHGPIAGYNDDGSIGGLIDVEWMYKAASKNNAAAHIERSVKLVDGE